ncbi:thioredoxin domain-containing protein [Kineosporia sp. J2-2]|uniref:Thioredoxin domain-containing protein n=1 Tax=Kineosporia corallincola TaxID=2835133 RepID=A0ABS5TCU6_9ACTN|nr:thioredoxin domain-containing protein [Kineosporia corallincola]MBT0768904.1 thioredoxin domain-containing protein [Kineosporia corallincola]
MASGRSTRDARQAKVAEMRAQAAKAEARRRNLLISGIVAALAVVIVVGFVVVQNASRDDKSVSDATPANIGTDNSIVDGEDSAPVKVVVYEDFQCPYCAQFEAANREQLAQYVKDGDVQVQYRPIAFLDRASTDDYSTRSLNAVAAVVNSSPDAFLEFHNLLFENQPEEGGAGLTDDQLVDYAVQAGADEATVKTAVDDMTYEGWTADVTDAASQAGVSGTPTVKINDTALESLDAASLKTAVDKALAAAK